MAVSGNRESLRKCNKLMKRTEPIVNIKQLKERYLYGIDIVDNAGKPLPDSAYQIYIDNAVSLLEHDLDISIIPMLNEIEDRDYHYNEYIDWGYFQLNNYPVIEIKALEMIFFRDANNEPEVLQTIPDNWIRLDAHSGIFRLVPSSSFSARLQVSRGGIYFPELLRSSIIPHAWRITYAHGFKDGCIPTLMNEAIGRLAASSALIIAGSLGIGAGIASTSLSIDGLSESISTTASAENSIYSAQRKEHIELLFGKTKNDPSAIINILRQYYKGLNITAI